MGAHHTLDRLILRLLIWHLNVADSLISVHGFSCGEYPIIKFQEAGKRRFYLTKA